MTQGSEMMCVQIITSWSAFTIGLLGAFILEFSRFIRQTKTLTQTFQIGKVHISTSKINWLAIVISVVYIVIGGVIASLFARTQAEAFLYGGLWQALFTYVIGQKNEI